MKSSAKGRSRRSVSSSAGRASTSTTKTRRSDFGAPVEGFFARQPLKLRRVLEALRELVRKAAPDARASIKWGMPFYEIDGEVMCALGAHQSHVNLILSGPPDAFDDPRGLLEGAAKTGRHMKLRRLDELPHAAVRAWLRRAAALARGKRRKESGSR